MKQPRSPRRSLASRLVCALMAGALTTTVAASSCMAAENKGLMPTAADPYRPSYHYTSTENFMNDPNGLIHKDGTYHLFYQYNPYGATSGNGSWGHATSTDLVHWARHPVAISTDENEDVWSGSVVFDKTNSSGLGTTDNPPLVAVYTSAHKASGTQRQALAYSLDSGETWAKYANNPVLDAGLKDFRDPKVWWDASTSRWLMVVAKSVDHKIAIYSSSDLKGWTHESDFGPAGVTSSVWECPDLFQLTDATTGTTKWVMSLSVAGRTAYFIGDFDGHTFSSPDAATYTPPAGTVLQGFESTSHGDWTTTGTAFGSGPVVPGADVTGVQGSRIVDSFGSSDADTGTLTSPAFTVDQKYLNFLIAGGNHPHVPDGQTAAPAGTVFADFEGATFGDGWAATGDFTGATPTTSNLAGQLGAKVLDTCVGACDPATGTIWSPNFTIDSAYINFLVAGGNHAWGGDAPTAVNLVVDGQVVRTATGNNSGSMDWVAWDVQELAGKAAHLEVVDERTNDWGHLMVDHVVFSDAAAKPWAHETTANLLVDGKVVRTATGNNGVGLDWVSWSLADLQGKQAQVQLVDTATGDWGHLLADHFMLAAKPALGVMKRARFLDHGNDFYAAVSYNDAPAGKRIVFGWMGNWDYQNATPTNTWRGEQSLPRELSLKMVNGRETVTSAPVPQLNKLLGKSAVRLRPGKGSVAVTSGVKKVDVFGTALRVQVTIDPGSSSSTGVDVRVGGGERTRVGYDAASREAFIDRTRSGDSGFDARFAARHSAPLVVGSSPVTLDVWVDSSSVEVFAQGGQVALTDLIYPSLGSTGVQLFAEGGTSQVKSLVVTPVKAAS